MKTAVLYYLPADVPPTEVQLAAAGRLLGCDVVVINDDTDPASTWLVRPEFGFVWLSLSSDIEPGSGHPEGDDVYENEDESVTVVLEELEK